jgi:hypothetical protein
MKLRRYIVLHYGVVTKFPWTVIDADSGEAARGNFVGPALHWPHPIMGWRFHEGGEN